MIKSLLAKLNYKGQERIAVIAPDENFLKAISEELKNVTIDQKIDPRFPYGFIIFFVRNVAELEAMAPMTFHNLVADGTLWICYPKKSSKKYTSDIDRDHGWQILNDSGLFSVRCVVIDDDWSALKFRNVKYIKSKSDRFNRKS